MLRVVVLASIVVLLAVTLVPTLARTCATGGDRRPARPGHPAAADVADLQKEQARWDDPAYVEQQARERLKFVKVGEKSYTVIDGARPADPADAPWPPHRPPATPRGTASSGSRSRAADAGPGAAGADGSGAGR